MVQAKDTGAALEYYKNKTKQANKQKTWFPAGRWWHTPLIPALGRRRQVDLCEFEASLVYKS